jgi:hypothetical protein
MRIFIICILYQILMEIIKSRRMRCVGHEAHMRQMRNEYKILAKKTEGKRPFRRPRHK